MGLKRYNLLQCTGKTTKTIKLSATPSGFFGLLFHSEIRAKNPGSSYDDLHAKVMQCWKALKLLNLAGDQLELN